MNKSFSIPPEQYARELLHTMKIDDIPIPVEGIAASLGIEIRYSDNMDAEAFLLRSGGKAIIAINTNGRYYSRKKFSIAHELGHYCIPGHKEEYRCTIQDL